jgi:hypothetical protein
MSIYDNKNIKFDTRPSDVILNELLSDDFPSTPSSQKEETAPTDLPAELTQQLTPEEIHSVLPLFSSFTPSSTQIDDDFIDLEPPTPTPGTRLSIKIVNCRQEANQPTNYGLKTVTNIDIDCFWDNGQIYRVTERFYRNPGDPISGRFKNFCADLFKAFDLKRVRLSDLIGRECTGIITYVPSQSDETKWPHLSNFEPLS